MVETILAGVATSTAVLATYPCLLTSRPTPKSRDWRHEAFLPTHELLRADIDHLWLSEVQLQSALARTAVLSGLAHCREGDAAPRMSAAALVSLDGDPAAWWT